MGYAHELIWVEQEDRIEDLERELEACCQELAKCREKLAAAEAAIRGVEYFNSYGMAQCPFCRAVLPYSHTVDCITQQPMTALDAVLEQAQDNTSLDIAAAIRALEKGGE